MPSRTSLTFRFAVGSTDGPRSGIWTLWTPSDSSEVYVAARQLAGSLKVSLHASGNWQAAFTTQFVDKLSRESKWSRGSRHVDKWRRPEEIAPGITLALRVLVPHSELHATPIKLPSTKPVTWVSASGNEYVSEFSVYFAAPQVVIITKQEDAKSENRALTSIPLSNGEKLWIVHHLLLNTGQLTSYIAEMKAKLKGRKPDLSTSDISKILPSHRIIIGGNDEKGIRYYYEFTAATLLRSE